MFQVRGTCAYDVRAMQVDAVTASLSSDDVFILETTQKTFLWIGKGASEREKEMARNAASLVPSKQPVPVSEGSEPNEFWDTLGGKGPYSTLIDEPYQDMDPRLFHCKILASGNFRTEEIQQYKQQDLDEEDVMLLDSGEEIYVWLGGKTSEDDKKQSAAMAEKYLQSDPSKCSHEHTLIFTLKQGEEPDNFTSLFPAWNCRQWD